MDKYKNTNLQIITLTGYILIFLEISCIELDGNSNISKAKSDIRTLSLALYGFNLDIGRYPTTEENLESLLRKPDTIEEDIWKGPYTDPPTEKEIIDPWGNKYIYRIPGIYNKDDFDLYSTGKDGLSKTGGNDKDDINNWSKDEEPWGFIIIVSIIMILLIILFFFIIQKIKKKRSEKRNYSYDEKSTKQCQY